MTDSYDIAVIGAGPAGMSAAITASNAGARVVVLDDKPQAGGQIYRHVTDSPLADTALLGTDYTKGADLVAEFNACRAEKITAANVWHVDESGEVLFSQAGASASLTAREVVVSVGAMERPFPIPGWHLPGVMTAGSAQVMLKSDGLVREDAVFVGSGPLLYLIVAQYLRLGVKVKALVDTTPKQNYLAASHLLPGAFGHLSVLTKGLGLLNEIRQAGVPVYKYAEDLNIRGALKAEALSFTSKGVQHELTAEHIFLHQGVIPNLNMTRAIGVEHSWNQQQLSWQPQTNDWGQTSVQHIAVAGDGRGIIGADAAQLSGQLVAWQQLARLGLISAADAANHSQPLQQKLKSYQGLRRFIDRLYQPMDALRKPFRPETMVCRCEEQTQGQLRAAFDQGARLPDELKGLTRCGMGPCQGRQCGHIVSELLAEWQGCEVEEVGYYRLRSPMRLINLTELARFQPHHQTARTEVKL
ncbi:NAD(P)/FAD-dependent oxidoreductase [Aliamphritea ceti]|uniref:NAD(P)/FAD-dependent oxidoreductase n=1 Tax=Aliamphritea ceti TaxID=1524258 RepID=UPI0021C2973E|nr:NAD(P)/FAD-dependent oxidoreductase [Aliamphritea ceti]